MKIISWNVNGLRSVLKKNFINWFNETNPDILCLQEIKVSEKDFPIELKFKDYYLYSNFANKKGYSGVLIYSKIKPKNIEYNLGIERFDNEGRFLRLDFKEFILINIYIPQGGRKKENLSYKLEVYSFFIDYLKNLNSKQIIIAGDLNVAHEEIDLARPKQNKNNAMFTIEERNKISDFVSQGFIDTFRVLNKDKVQYSWWPYYNNLRERNIGWRLDYIFVSKSFLNFLRDAFILSNIKGSDHCPIGVEI